MKLPQFSVKHPVTVTMFYLAIIVLSLVSLTKLSLDIFPEITYPALTISTTYSGAGPEDIENKVTSLIESSVGVVPDLKEIRSTSVEDQSTITLLFNWGTNLDEVANDVRSRLEFVKRYLPDEAEAPMMLKFDMSQTPILFLSASARENFRRINTLLTDEIAEPLKSVNGIGNIFVIGGPERQIRVDVDKTRLDAYKISLSQISQALAASNVTMPAGDLKVGGQSFFLRIPAEFSDVSQIGKTLIGGSGGRSVFLEDVAKVTDGIADTTVVVRQEKEKAAWVVVQKKSGANTVKVADAVLKELETLKTKLPKDVNISVAFDFADTVKQTISSLADSVWVGGILVVLVTFIFLFNFRSSLVILVAIPISLIVSFLFLYLMGYTINIMSLSSIAIAIGMVVDNSIVVLENIIRHRTELKEDKVESAINGAGEVGLAVSASTFTTVVVFLPLIFTGGLVGILFKQLGSVISITLLVSLAVSLTLSPMIASFMDTGTGSVQKYRFLNAIKNVFESMLNSLNGTFRSILVYSFSNRKKVVALAAAVFILSLGLIPFIGTEFMPQEDSGFITSNIKMPVNTAIETADMFSLKLIDAAQKIAGGDRSLIFTRTGQSGFGGGHGSEGANVISINVRLKDKDERKRSDKDISQAMRTAFSNIPGPWKIDFTSSDSSSQFGGSSKPLSVEILGYDITTADMLSERIKGIMENTKGAVDVTVSRERGKLEYQLVIDRPKLARLGITPSVVADTINIAFNGRTATLYREGKDEFDVYVQLRDENRKELKDVLGLTILTQDGRSFLVSDLVSTEIKQGPYAIDRKDQQRLVSVEANVYGRSLGEVSAEIEKQIKAIPLPTGVSIDFAGTVKEQKDSFRDLSLAFLLGMLLTYMVMAAQFESFRDPFIIMFSVPFAVVGVLWGLFLTGQTLNVTSFIGLVMLVGIVVNNAIVFVDYTIQLRAKGVGVRESLLESARVRLRPILMTTLTTIFGMLPLAISNGQGSESWKPLAVSVIGGLMFSTLITLVLVPVLYDIFEERIRKF